MSQHLTLEYLETTIPKRHKKQISQELVDEINHLTLDPDYGESFKSTLLTASVILDGKVACTLKQYVAAVKYYSLTAASLTFVDAYIKVFPERLQARLDRGEDKSNMGGEASRYNASETVNAIRKQALIPLHLINQGTVQLAINTLTEIMLNARSDMARVTAANTLIKELRPPEAQQVELQLGLSDEARAAQSKQAEQLADIAINQRRLLEAGVAIEDVQRIYTTTVDAELVDE